MRKVYKYNGIEAACQRPVAGRRESMVDDTEEEKERAKELEELEELEEAGMIEVTRDHFLAAMRADPRDIMPSLPTSVPAPRPYTYLWRARGGELFGKSAYGGRDGMRYWLVSS